TAPITVLMNSARIALIGVTAEHFGRAAAEGFLHDFEGWAVFAVCMAALFAEMALLARFSGRRLADVFGIDLPARPPGDAVLRQRATTVTLGAALLVLGLAAAAYAVMPQPRPVMPARSDFGAFPLTLGGWHGQPERMNPVHLGILRLDDYLLAN